MTRRVKTRCCGLSLQVGTKIIAFFSMVTFVENKIFQNKLHLFRFSNVAQIGYLIQLVIGMIQSSNLNLNDGMVRFLYFVKIMSNCRIFAFRFAKPRRGFRDHFHGDCELGSDCVLRFASPRRVQ